MKCLLASRGPLTQKQSDELEILVGKKFTGLNLLFCITASNRSGGNKNWMIDNMSHLKELGFNIDVCDLRGANKDSLISRFENADVFYFEGGDTPWLRESFRLSGLEKHLPKLLETKVWIGISAGGCVLCPYYFSSCEQWFTDTTENPQKGLGLLDIQFVPHLNSRHFPGNTIDKKPIVTKNFDKIDSKALYCIDDSEAISINGNTIKFLNEGESFQL